MQNRFYADTGYDVAIRAFCRAHGMEYQSFWTLGANQHALRDARVQEYATARHLTPETLMYAYCMAVDITPLDGTRNADHMREDMVLLQRVLRGEEIFTASDLQGFAEILGISDQEQEL